MTDEPPAHLIDWQGDDWTPDSDTPAAHPNARFTAPAGQCPSIAPEWEDPKGVPISAILFGGRRATNVPLVTEAFDWQHGVFLGSIMSSEKTAAAAGTVGEVRFDPFAMLPVLRLQHRRLLRPLARDRRGHRSEKLPKLFWVNWFRKDDDGQFIWPGFGENSRVLKWVLERVEGTGEAVDTPIGRVPATGALDTTGLDLDDDTLARLIEVDRDQWRDEVARIEEHYDFVGEQLPAALRDELRELEKRLAE